MKRWKIMKMLYIYFSNQKNGNLIGVIDKFNKKVQILGFDKEGKRIYKSRSVFLKNIDELKKYLLKKVGINLDNKNQDWKIFQINNYVKNFDIPLKIRNKYQLWSVAERKFI